MLSNLQHSKIWLAGLAVAAAVLVVHLRGESQHNALGGRLGQLEQLQAFAQAGPRFTCDDFKASIEMMLAQRPETDADAVYAALRAKGTPCLKTLGAGDDGD